MRSSLRADRRVPLAEGAAILLALPLWIWWATWKGGYPPSVFLAGIGYLALAAVALSLAVPRGRIRGAAGWALAALGFLTCWTIVSLLWAEDRGAAEVAAARQVLLFGSVALPVVWPVSRRALVLALGAVPLLALCGALSALFAALADPAGLLDGRLVDPTGYANASAALFAAGGLTALVVSSRRELRGSVRAGALATAGVLVGSCVLCQSRGSLLAMAVTLVIVFALVSGRRRLLVALLILVLCTLPGLATLLDVHRVAVGGGDLEGAVRQAFRVLTFTAIGLFAAGLLYAWLDARIEVSERVSRIIDRGIAGLAATAALAAVVVLMVAGADIGGWVSQRVEDFKTPDYGRLEAEPDRFTGGLGSNRFDYWRVSLDVYADRPVGGAGAGNFLAPYLERRRAAKATLYSHSLWLGTLAELGTIGFLALVAFLASLAVALARAARSLGGGGRWIAVAAALPAVYVLVHGSFDWITAYPVILVPPFALAAAAAAARPDEEWATESSVARWPALGLVTSLLVCGVLAVPLLLSARLADRGFSSWPARPAGAIDDLRRAADLDPLSTTADVRLGVVAVELGRDRLAERAFADAIDRDRSGWFPWFESGLLAAASGRLGIARDDVRRALSLNPREPAVRRAMRALRRGDIPSPRRAQGEVLEQTSNN